MNWLKSINDRVAELTDNAVDPETGIVDDAAFDEIQRLLTDSAQLAEDIGLMIKHLDAETEGIKAEKRAYADDCDSRIKANEKRVERLKAILIDGMNGQNLVTDRVAIKFTRKREGLILDKADERAVLDWLIDNEMFDSPAIKQKYELSRTELGKLVKDGAVVPHCEWGKTAEYTCSCK